MAELWVPDKYRAPVAKDAPAGQYFQAEAKSRALARVPASTADAVRQGATTTSPFAPGLPLRPYHGVDGMPRTWDFPTGYNIKARADREGRYSFDTLKAITDNYEVARLCIQHRIDDVRSLDWTVVPADGAEKNIPDVIALAKRILRKPDGIHPFQSWLSMYLEDVLRYDAGVLVKRRNRAGRVIGLNVVSGRTIGLVSDDWGLPPTGDAPAYVQYVQGLPWMWFTRDAMVYQPFRPQPDSMYGFAPIEAAMMTANTHLRFQNHWLNWFTDGNVPFGFATLPEGLSSPTQRDQFQDAWNATHEGAEATKNQLTFMPYGTQFEWPKDQPFDSTFAVYLMKIVCAVFGVTPQDIGFTDDVNRATGETQADIQFRVGTRPLLKHIEGILTGFLQDDIGLPVQFQFDEGRESEDRLSSAKVWEIGVKVGAVSPDEFREDFFGKEIDQERPTPRSYDSNTQGPIPLRSVDAVAGPIDPDTMAPSEDAPLGTEAFAGTPGVLPHKSPGSPQFARAPIDPDDPEHPDTEHEVPGSGVIAPPAPVGKDAGITAASGVTGYDLAGNPRPRKSADEPVEGVIVRSAQGSTSVAGLAVVAGDTGRVLMIQRAIIPEDPAAGKWEFPGGHLEDGEGPLAAAAREWSEETGLQLPGTVAHVDSWDNGPYRLHVATVPREDDLPINPDQPTVVNPDDPDGDITETVAWWDVADLPGMPALRAECADTPWDILTDATPGTLEGIGKRLATWRGHARKSVDKGHLPRRFNDSGLPASVEARVWSRLRGARDRGTVDAAFASAVVKAADADPKGGWRADPPSAEPQHRMDLSLTDHYAPEVQQALGALWSEAQITQHTESIVGSGAREAALMQGLVAMSFGQSMDPSDLSAALTSLWADAYRSGTLASAKQLGMADQSEWDAWKPGFQDAQAVTRDGGWAAAISEAGVTLKGLHGESLKLVGSAIEDGVAKGRTIDQIAKDIRGTVGSASRAELIAHTETARMLTRASVHQYQQLGVAQFDLVISAGACPSCVNIASSNPHPIGDRGSYAPVHPRCRCAVAPVTGLTAAAMADPDGTGFAPVPYYPGTMEARDAEAAAASTGASRASEYTYDNTAHLTDVDLGNLLVGFYDTDPAAADKIEAIINERDAKGVPITTDAWGAGLAVDSNPLTNPAVRAERKLTPRQSAAEEYDQYAMAQYSKALDNTNGVLLNAAGKAYARSGHPDLEWEIFRGPWQVANKYASEELQQWWTENGRETQQSFRYALYNWDSDRAAAENVRLRGHSRTALASASDRSQQ